MPIPNFQKLIKLVHLLFVILSTKRVYGGTFQIFLLALRNHLLIVSNDSTKASFELVNRSENTHNIKFSVHSFVANLVQLFLLVQV